MAIEKLELTEQLQLSLSVSIDFSLQRSLCKTTEPLTVECACLHNDKNIESLITFLRENTNVSSLLIADTQKHSLNKDIMQKILQGLSCVLEKCSAQKLTFRDLHFTSECLQEIAKGITHAKSLTHLVFLQCKLCSDNPTGMEALTLALGAHPTLKTLELIINAININEAELLAQAIVKNPKIETLNLEQSSIDSTGILFMMPFLMDSSLKTLNLRSTEISDVGAGMLAYILMKNRTLVTLDLSDNDLSLEAVRVLAVAINYNKTIQTIIFENNDYKLDAITRENAGNYSVKTIMSYSEFDENVHQKIKEISTRTLEHSKDKSLKEPASPSQPIMPLLQLVSQKENVIITNEMNKLSLRSEKTIISTHKPDG
jgi:Ran GTPase-activating protein (RanGAP) involved in mRNA processing and transport